MGSAICGTGMERAENRVQILHEKARVFEYRQTAEIQYQRKNQKNLFPPALDEPGGSTS